eukprot:TRINITY_DN349_c0_g1_i1.p1 TRINITY_DN349_c0_g1~~TRINITY_DN349_c0_g1_i1.p1  ORF type:complete len:298 (+),score=24.10 TRINITY_DN349_c0_g1_i1:711-1604(+)
MGAPCTHVDDLLNRLRNNQLCHRLAEAATTVLVCPLCHSMRANHLLMLEQVAKDATGIFRDLLVDELLPQLVQQKSNFQRQTRTTVKTIAIRNQINQDILVNPVRGKQCRHADCFELLDYLERWHIHKGKCELCNKTAPLKSLALDAELQHFCKQDHVRESGHERANLHPDNTLTLPSDTLLVLNLEEMEVPDRPVKEEIVPHQGGALASSSSMTTQDKVYEDDDIMPWPQDAPKEVAAWEALGVKPCRRRGELLWVFYFKPDGAGRKCVTSKDFWKGVEKALAKINRSLPNTFRST